MRRKSVNLVLTACVIASTLPVRAATAADREIVVTVLDAKNFPVSTLAPEDLTVREDGVAREVLRVRKATAPLTIALLVDDSTAATPAAVDLRNGIQDFIKAFEAPPEMAIITFGDRPTVVVDYTKDQGRLVEGAKRLFPRSGAGAYLLDAVTETSKGLAKRAPERPVMVAILTEGVEFSTESYRGALDRLAASGAQFHAVVIGGGPEANPAEEEVRNRNIVIDEGTRTTGGRREQLLSPNALPGALKSLAAELEHQWIVTYSRPESLIQPERVQVEAKRPGLTVRARTRVDDRRTPK